MDATISLGKRGISPRPITHNQIEKEQFALLASHRAGFRPGSPVLYSCPVVKTEWSEKNFRNFLKPCPCRGSGRVSRVPGKITHKIQAAKPFLTPSMLGSLSALISWTVSSDLRRILSNGRTESGEVATRNRSRPYRCVSFDVAHELSLNHFAMS